MYFMLEHATLVLYVIIYVFFVNVIHFCYVATCIVMYYGM